VSDEITDANRPTITFAGTTVSGFAGCNTFTGTVAYNHGMGFGQLATTSMACEEPATSIGSTFLQLMDQVRGYELKSARLHMQNEDGLIVLTFLKS
jgi:heat shock protein HslJ